MSFTTQVPTFATALQSTSSALTFSFRSGLQIVNASIREDAHRGHINITRIQLRPAFNIMRDCEWQTTRQAHHRIQRVVSVRNPLRWALRIQTTFGEDSSLPSGYGRGTTTSDVASGDTSLAFHESQHGAAALNYINTHALPLLTITAGMTRQRVTQAMRAFHVELNHYNSNLRYLEIQEVDCVGIPMSEQACG